MSNEPTTPDSDEIDDAGYPRTEQLELEGRAAERFAAKIEEHGPGRNWVVDEPRDHIFKAVDELCQARDPAQAGDYDTAAGHFSDAYNHLLFAMELTRHQDPEKPSLESFFGDCVVCDRVEADFTLGLVIGELTLGDVNYHRAEAGLGPVCRDCARTLGDDALPSTDTPGGPGDE